MKDNMQKVKYTPLSVTLETVDHLIREYGTDALALYMAYCAIAEWQKTKIVKATEGFMKKRLNWGQDKFRKNKKILKEEGYIVDIQKKGSDGKIQGNYIEIHYLVHSVDNPTSGKSQSMVNPTPSALDETKVLIDENISAIRRNTSENKFSQDITTIMELFSTINPSIQYGNKTQRKACKDMILKFGASNVIHMVEQVILVQGQKYAPTATTPYAMYTKLGDFKVYFDKSKTASKVLDLSK
jgi:hypothetical protein